MDRQKYDDYGGEALILPLVRLAMRNEDFRVALWTGEDMQVTLMSIPSRSDIGLECHTGLEQMLIAVSGSGIVRFGETKENLSDPIRFAPGDAFMIPENTWHNVENRGRTPLKLISVYAPPQHPFGTVTPRKEDEEHIDD